MIDTGDTAACLAEWSSRGPRYTSYPPATEFRAMSAETVQQEISTIGANREAVSLYLHIPFCQELCWYCGCNVIPTRDAQRGIDYVEALKTEMALLSGPLEPALVTEIALGGGSPNFLAPKTMRTVMAAVERYFEVTPDARQSVELDPRVTTTAQIETLRDLGFTSASLGVQDFAEPVQDAIRRHQSVVQTRWLVECARSNGFDDINVDIVYGLPRQTEASFTDTIDAVIALAPDRVALFGYAHLPSKFPHQALVERAGRVLDRYERATLLLLAIERFTRAGYVHLGLDHFARPGSRLARAGAEQRMVRTFQGYVEHRADSIVGLGTSAISSTPRIYWQNHARLGPWQEALAAQRLPVERGYILDADDRARAALIRRLMCDGSVDLARIGREHCIDPETYFARELSELGAKGDLASYDAATHTVQTTAIGRMLVRNVCMLFDRYHDGAGEARHSSTI